jgi:hypothetical protein
VSRTTPSEGGQRRANYHSKTGQTSWPVRSLSWRQRSEKKPGMKLYGYITNDAKTESVIPSTLAEVTLFESPAELRKIAAFLTFAATTMEQMGRNYSDEHMSDKAQGFRRSPHFVVAPRERGLPPVQ